MALMSFGEIYWAIIFFDKEQTHTSSYQAASCVWLTQIAQSWSKPFPILLMISILSFKYTLVYQFTPSASLCASAAGTFEYQRCCALSLISCGVNGKWSFCISPASSANTLVSAGLRWHCEVISSVREAVQASQSWRVDLATSKWFASPQIECFGLFW